MEISPVFTAEDALNHYLLAYEYSKRNPNHKAGKPISCGESTQAAEAIILLVNSIEGYFNRVIYLLIKNNNWSADLLNERVGSKFNKLIGGTHPLKQDYDEVIVVRNALTHSHIYETERTNDREIINVQILALVNDKTWKRVVDQITYKTHKLGLNAIPSEICFYDAKKVFTFWTGLYEAMKVKYPQYYYLQPLYPNLYKSLYRSKPDLEEKLNQAFRNEGTMEGWTQFYE
ncbi:hypothetical protein HY844_02865 [Candidatus Berkelbacteria bacterium]|nr:hypothetical protein [Candidatus Berkelbacteria bacterium]